MIKRPKSSDSEQDLLQMQMDYMKEKEKDKSFQPAAKVVKMASKTEKKQSQFAKRRGLKSTTQEDMPIAGTSSANIVLGEIVERSAAMEVDEISGNSSSESFPVVEKLDTTIAPVKGKSLFSLMRNKGQASEQVEEEVVGDFGTQSFVIQGSDAEVIHSQNVDTLSKMSPVELNMEREKLIQSMDPSLIDFIKQMRSKKSCQIEPEPVKPTVESAPVIPDLAHVAQEKNWVNFNEIEDEKLEWMKDVTVEVPRPKEGESYEARFDWKGTLLPFNDDDTASGDNRELYLHGDEPHRPGYTLQELFRLARSDVLQQRVSALTAIQGMLAIYNQGFYDQVLELPISKIFFLLRFSLDDKAVPVVEQSVIGLANLFYNNSDEFLLDCIFDTKLGRSEPVLRDSKKRMQLEFSFKKMSVSGTYQTPVPDEEAMLKEDAALNDFQLAETDLVKCLLRTNIIERIQYLVNILKPGKDSKIVESCVKILIRICRYGPDGVEKITESYHLIDGLIDTMEENESPKQTRLIIKLFRVIIGYSIVSADLNVPLLIEMVKKIIYNRDNLNMDLIRLQIEALRLIRINLQDLRYHDLYNDFIPAIRYLFEWHYQFLDITDSRSAFIHQHASSMIALLSHPLFCFDRNMCTEIMVLCFRKWLTITTSYLQSNNSTELDFSQNVLLAVIVEFCTDHKLVYQAIKDLYVAFVSSSGFKSKIMNRISSENSLINIASDRSEILPQLPNFGSVAFNQGNKVSLIVPQTSPVILINASIRLLLKHDRDILGTIQAEQFHKVLVNFSSFPKYLEILKRNWFCRHDLELIFSILQSNICRDIALVLKVTGLSLSCLNMRVQIEHLLREIFFNPLMYENKLGYSDPQIRKWKDVYMQYYLMRQSTASNEAGEEESLFPVKWPYEILNIFYEQHVESKDKKGIWFNIEKETEDRLIKVSLGMTTLLEANGVFMASPTERLIHLMMAFLSPECRFLDSSIKEDLLNRAVALKNSLGPSDLFQFKSDHFDFDSFYTVLLNQFQSAGYADKLFSALIMIPLSTQYENKYRKMVWSEHVAVLRFVSCTEEELIFTSFADFVKERRLGEKDDNYEVSLLKSYHSALNSRQLRPDSLPYKIAKFYLEKK